MLNALAYRQQTVVPFERGPTVLSEGGPYVEAMKFILPYAYSEGTSNRESLPADLCCAIAVLVW